MFNVKTTAFVATALLSLASANGAMAGGNTTPNASSTPNTAIVGSSFATFDLSNIKDADGSFDAQINSAWLAQMLAALRTVEKQTTSPIRFSLPSF